MKVEVRACETELGKKIPCLVKWSASGGSCKEGSLSLNCRKIVIVDAIELSKVKKKLTEGITQTVENILKLDKNAFREILEQYKEKSELAKLLLASNAFQD